MSKLADDYRVDQTHLYAVGYSQGGSFLHRLLDEMPDKFAAACEVGGWMTGGEERGAKGLSLKSEMYTSEHYREVNHIIDEAQIVVENLGERRVKPARFFPFLMVMESCVPCG